MIFNDLHKNRIDHLKSSYGDDCVVVEDISGMSLMSMRCDCLIQNELDATVGPGIYRQMGQSENYYYCRLFFMDVCRV